MKQDWKTQDQEQNQSALITDNKGYGDAGFLQYRLNTDPLLADIELYLRGERVGYQEDKDGNTIKLRHVTGERKTNDIGVQSIMAYIQSMINPMTVQGNIDDDSYRLYLCRHRKSFATYLMVNRHKFMIEMDEFSGVIDTIFALVELFITRPINNLERKTLMPGSHRYQEQYGGQNLKESVPGQKKKGLTIF